MPFLFLPFTQQIFREHGIVLCFFGCSPIFPSTLPSICLSIHLSILHPPSPSLPIPHALSMYPHFPSVHGE